MILILSHENDEHVPCVTRKLEALGADYFWFNPACFPAQAEICLSYDRGGIARRVLRCCGRDVDLARLTAVWHRRPGTPLAAPEVREQPLRKWVSEESRHCLAGVWEDLDCLWVPGKPRADRDANDKMRQLALAARLGFRIPRTLITNSPEGFLEFYRECGGRLVTKVLWMGGFCRDSSGEQAYTHLAHTQVVERRHAANYRAIRHAPLILQEYVPKQVELRITVVGSRVFAAEIHSQASRCTRHDWRHYDDERATSAPHALPATIETLCVRLVRTLGLCFGAIDMVVTPEGEYVFLEINPNGQWAWIEDLTELPISAAIAHLLVHSAVAPEKGKEIGARNL